MTYVDADMVTGVQYSPLVPLDSKLPPWTLKSIGGGGGTGHFQDKRIQLQLSKISRMQRGLSQTYGAGGCYPCFLLCSLHAFERIRSREQGILAPPGLCVGCGMPEMGLGSSAVSRPSWSGHEEPSLDARLHVESSPASHRLYMFCKWSWN